MSKASDYRKRLQQKESPTAEITLPSGAVFVCRRPPLQVWISAGRIPQSFVKHLLEAQKGGAVPELESDETLAAMAFVREAILYAVVEPRLVPGTKHKDELDPADIDPEDFEFLMTWIMQGCPGVPVLTKGGEVGIDSLARFREAKQKRTRGKPFSVESDGTEVRDEAEHSARTG